MSVLVFETNAILMFPGKNFAFFTCLAHLCHIYSPLYPPNFHNSNNTKWPVQSRNSPKCNNLNCPLTLSSWGPHIFLGILFLNTCTLRFPTKCKTASHTHKRQNAEMFYIFWKTEVMITVLGLNINKLAKIYYSPHFITDIISVP